MRAIMIETFGGPEVLQVRDDVPDPLPERGQELLDVSSAGINYADTHAAANDYLSPQTLPFVPGSEVVGRRRAARASPRSPSAVVTPNGRSSTRA